jgi:outer membrane protein assembly factor BamB
MSSRSYRSLLLALISLLLLLAYLATPSFSLAGKAKPPVKKSLSDRKKKEKKKKVHIHTVPPSSKVTTPTLPQGLASPADEEWLSYGHDDQLTNSVSSKDITSSSVPRLAPVWHQVLDSWVAGSPLLSSDGGPGKTDILIVPTEAGSVYGINPHSGAVLWRDNFGVITTPNCGDWGISTSGIIDKKRGLYYTVSSDGYLHALNLADGSEYYSRDLLSKRNTIEYVWGGLRISNDHLYVPVASYCDDHDAMGLSADGRLIDVSLDNPNDPFPFFKTVPAYGELGGIWGYGGTSIDPRDGSLYFGVGNSITLSPSCNCIKDNSGYGDSLVRLDPSLNVISNNNPGVPDHGDEDFGSAPLLFQPPGCPPLAAANNKAGYLYIWNRDKIADGPIASLGLNDGADGFIGAPSYSSQTGMFYDSQVVYKPTGVKDGYGVAAFSFDKSCVPHEKWRSRLGDGGVAAPTIVNDVVFASAGEKDFFAFNAYTGDKVWQFDTGERQTMTPLIEVKGSLFGVAGQTLYSFIIPKQSSTATR